MFMSFDVVVFKVVIVRFLVHFHNNSFHPWLSNVSFPWVSNCRLYFTSMRLSGHRVFVLDFIWLSRVIEKEKILVNTLWCTHAYTMHLKGKLPWLSETLVPVILQLKMSNVSFFLQTHTDSVYINMQNQDFTHAALLVSFPTVFVVRLSLHLQFYCCSCNVFYKQRLGKWVF